MRDQSSIFGIVYTETWRMYKQHFWLFFVVALLISWVGAFIPKAFILAHPVAAFFISIISGLVQLIGAASIIATAKLFSEGAQAIGIGQALRLGMIPLFTLIGATILCLLIGLVGMVFLIIPGLVFAFFACLYLPIVVCEKVTAWGSIKRSCGLVKHHWVVVFCVTFFGSVLMGFVAFVPGLLFAYLQLTNPQGMLRIVAEIMSFITSAITLSFYSLLSFHLLRVLTLLED